MSTVSLSAADLAISALLIVALACLTLVLKLGLTQSLLVSAVRTVVQLSAIGVILKILFDSADLRLTAVIVLVMFCVAGYETTARQNRPFTGWWGPGIGAAAMVLSSATVTLLALTVVIGPQPWHSPQYLVPLLGMVLGNTMNGIAISLDRLSSDAAARRPEIEAQLLLGYGAKQAIAPVRRAALRAGFIPIINGMAAAGVVSLPGMMTGQILAGNPPFEAAKYQILVMFLIAGGTGFGAIIGVRFAAARLFDQRERLRLDRLRPAA